MQKEEAIIKLGARIRDLRKEKDMTQLQLAHAVGKDQQSIQRLEAGNMNPTFFYLTEIATGLGVQIEDLVKNL